jgi:glutamate N-acetyltransferase/amino-acid N-acetyltransferase
MSITAPRGFVATGIGCGIKEGDALDLALVATEDSKPVPAAGVFTTNKATAAPVVVSKKNLRSTSGRAAGVVVSSGNANAATGAKGIADVERICDLVSGSLGVSSSEILVCQTGLIGIPFPVEKVEASVGRLTSSLGGGRDSAGLAARAMMTTDTFAKETVVEGGGYVVGGMAKGAAMLAPDMATMLCVLSTDASCDPALLARCLARATAATFNRMTIDGCTSTNDTVLVLASGRAGVAPTEEELTSRLEQACRELAAMMAGDAEGATKSVRVTVLGAASDDEANSAAKRVASSMLVKCSLNGEDPYWGRVVSELGSAGVEFELDRVVVAYGGVTVCRDGIASAHDRDALSTHMKQDSIEITCDLGIGSGRGTVLSCDLGYGYIDENRTTS